jgi:hypothetical protein
MWILETIAFVVLFFVAIKFAIKWVVEDMLKGVGKRDDEEKVTYLSDDYQRKVEALWKLKGRREMLNNLTSKNPKSWEWYKNLLDSKIKELEASNSVSFKGD